MPDFKLYKSEKLCSKTAIDRLFADGESTVAYPLRMVSRLYDRPYGASAQFMITIPKKKIRTAVGRVLLRRRIREAYRLNHARLLDKALSESGLQADIAFIYMAPDTSPYVRIEKKLNKLLAALAAKAAQTRANYTTL